MRFESTSKLGHRLRTLARTAERKLTSAGSRQDHDLRVIVGHANLLESLTRGSEAPTLSHIEGVIDEVSEQIDDSSSDEESCIDTESTLLLFEMLARLRDATETEDSESEDGLSSSTADEEETDGDDDALLISCISHEALAQRDAKEHQILAIESGPRGRTGGSLKLDNTAVSQRVTEESLSKS